jgi:hypothetical protein
MNAATTGLDALLQERLDLAEQIAPLWALYGSGGTWPAERDALAGKIYLEVRDLLERRKVKETGVWIEARIHDDHRYLDALGEAEAGRTNLYALRTRMMNLNDRILSVINRRE